MSYRIPEETKRAIIDAARIDEVVGDFVVLKKRGANYLGLCPFHHEKTPSFIVSPAKGIFKCFGCGKGGDSVSFVMEHEHFDYVEALRYLARKYNIEIQEQEVTPEQRKRESERESLYHVTEYASQYFIHNLWESEEGRSVGLSYFRERKFTDAIIKQFQLGYCSESWDGLTQAALKAGYDKKYLVQSGLTIEKEETGKLFDRFRSRVIFPIHSLSGRVLGFGGRILVNDKNLAKYVNSPESDIYHKSNVLYAIPFAKKEIVAQDMAYMVEGYADVISLHQAGITNVVSSSGTSLTEDQIKMLSHFTKNITLLYDGDPAGIKASLRGIDMVLAKDMNVRVVLLPDGQDPDDFARSHSTDDILAYLKSNAVDFITFKTRLLLADAGSDPIRRAELIDNILTSISVIPDEIKRAVYVQECSRILDIAEPDLLQKLNRIFRSNFQKELKQRQIRQAGTSGSVQEADSGSMLPEGMTAPGFPAGDLSQIFPSPSAPRQTGSDMEKQQKAMADAQAYRLTLERELLGLMVNFGKENTSQIYLEDGKEIPQVLSVCAYIVMEIQQDGLDFSTPAHKELFSTFANAFAQSYIPSVEDLMLNEDAAIRTLVADLTAQRFEISKVWEEKGIFVPTVENTRSNLDQAVSHSVLNFKLLKVNELLDKVNKDLRQAEQEGDEMRVFELLGSKKQIDQLKVILSGMLRKVVA